ncbi:MAG TPA: mandelate racemase/muconate lactonizing enzyme family protein [Burkholderiales bacterium]
MQIERIEAIPLRMPLARPLKAGTVAITHRCTVLTRVYTKDGVMGECFSNNENTGQAEIIRIIHEEIAPRLIGRNAFHVEAAWQAMHPITRDFLRDRRMAIRAMACVDAALWDTVGKALNAPLHRLWGGMRDEIPVVAMGAYYYPENDLQNVAREMAGLREMGVKGCKLKIGAKSPKEDAERVRAAREGGGPDFWLMPDPNQGWTYDQALEFVRLVEDIDLYWIEEPCLWQNDRKDLARLRKTISIPICAGQSEITKAGCHALMEEGALDICNFDPSWGGGPTEWRKVAAVADTYGIPVLSHLEPQVGAALAASVPNGLCVEMMQESRDPLYHAIIENKPAIKDGMMKLSELPGWGMVLDKKLEAKLRA